MKIENGIVTLYSEELEQAIIDYVASNSDIRADPTLYTSEIRIKAYRNEESSQYCGVKIILPKGDRT